MYSSVRQAVEKIGHTNGNNFVFNLCTLMSAQIERDQVSECERQLVSEIAATRVKRAVMDWRGRAEKHDWQVFKRL